MREEWETWQLINEILVAEKLFFDEQLDYKQNVRGCPKTLELSELLKNHHGLLIHAVAHWLEKIDDTQINFGVLDQ